MQLQFRVKGVKERLGGSSGVWEHTGLVKALTSGLMRTNFGNSNFRVGGSDVVPEHLSLSTLSERELDDDGGGEGGGGGRTN